MFKHLTDELFKHWHLTFFIGIALLALFLRTYKLQTVPAGLSVDEASIGYNAYGILTNHRDEWLVRTPLSFKAFGEFKPPIAIYATALTTSVFGLNHFGIRLPMALAGVATVMATFWIARKATDSVQIGLLSMALMAVSPINLHFSRMAFESSIGVALVTCAVAFYLWADHSKKHSLLYLFSFTSFALAMYSNHATKLFVPFVMIFLVLHSFKVWIKRPAGVIIGGILFLLLCLPLLNQIVHGAGSERFFMVSAITIKGEFKPWPEIFQVIATNYLAHLTPSFLIFGETDSYRHGNYVFGILSYLEFIFLFIGIFSIFKTKHFRAYWWVLALIVVAFLPAAIGTTIPHPNRVHHVVPWIQLISGIGLWYSFAHLPTQFKKPFAISLVGLFMLQLVWQQRVYYRVLGTIAAQDFQYGYQEAVKYAVQYEELVDEIYFTSKYDHPYIYLLLYKKMTPMTYHFGGLIKYRLMNIKWQELKSKQNTLIIAAPDEVPNSVPVRHYVYYPDGSIAFKIIRL